MRVQPAGLAFADLFIDVLIDIVRQILSLHRHESHNVVCQAAFGHRHGKLVVRHPVSHHQFVQTPGGRFDNFASGEPHFVSVGIEFHLPQQETAHTVPDHHQHPQHFPGQPDAASSKIKDDADADVVFFAPSLQVHVPFVTLIDNSREPMADRPHDVAQAHSTALCKMAELMSQDSAQLSYVHIADKR